MFPKFLSFLLNHDVFMYFCGGTGKKREMIQERELRLFMFNLESALSKNPHQWGGFFGKFKRVLN